MIYDGTLVSPNVNTEQLYTTTWKLHEEKYVLQSNRKMVHIKQYITLMSQ